MSCDEAASADALTPAELQAVVTPDAFTEDYDRAVDALEDEYLSAAFDAVGTLDVDGALEGLSSALSLRRHYLEVLDLAAVDLEHPLVAQLPLLREYAEMMHTVTRMFEAVLLALQAHQRGHTSTATRLLDDFQASLPPMPEFFEGAPILAGNVRIAAEAFTGMIRSAALDHAAARAAHDRAVAVARSLLEYVQGLDREGTEGLQRSTRFQISLNEAYSWSMQFNQLNASGDYVGAGQAARAASECYRAADDAIASDFPAIGALLRASSFEALALGCQSEANLILERGDWERAEELVATVRTHYQSASTACLASRLSVATLVQERYLNAGFAWSVNFRRAIERERAHAAQIASVEAELANLRGSVGSALASGGVVVNNSTEMVNSVQQHVELTNRLEVNLRRLLTDAPAAIEQSALDADDKQRLTTAARDLEMGREDGVTFLSRVRGFARDLGAAVRSSAATAGPVIELLKALSVLD